MENIMPTINDLDREISRLKFVDRARFCEMMTRQRLYFGQPKPHDEIDGSKEAYNHELELLSFRSSIVGETAVSYYENKVWYKRCMKIIGEQEYFRELIKLFGAEKTMSAIAFMQFPGQQSYSFLIYRYRFMYTFKNDEIDMNKTFYNHFNVPYSDFEAFVFMTQLWSSIPDYIFFSEIVKLLSEPMIKVLEKLSSTREQITKQYNAIKSGNDILSFIDLNLLLKTPFIKEGDVYFCMYAPFVPYAGSQSLMFSITEGKEKLRSLIGKNVFEAYLYDICSKSEVTNIYSIEKEFQYISHKQNVLSPDLTIYSDTDLLFIETKFFNQSIRLRRFDETEFDQIIDRLADGIVQVIKNRNNLKSGLMDGIIHKAAEKTVYCLMITYDEFYMSKERIYQVASEKLVKYEIVIPPIDLKKLIRLTSIGAFEGVLYHSAENIFSFCKKLFSVDQTWDDKYLIPYVNSDHSRMPQIDLQFSNIRKSNKDNLQYVFRAKIPFKE